VYAGRSTALARFCLACGLPLATAGPSAAPPSGPRKRVLLVEDSRVLRGALCKLIASLGHEPVEANNGSEALALATGQCPDLIITDLVMPEMGGFELIDRLHAHPDLRRVPVIVLTSQHTADTITQGLARNVVDYIVKDISRMKEIRDRLVRHL
jgi:CheY-like chemotaxis protein